MAEVEQAIDLRPVPVQAAREFRLAHVAIAHDADQQHFATDCGSSAGGGVAQIDVVWSELPVARDVNAFGGIESVPCRGA